MSAADLLKLCLALLLAAAAAPWGFASDPSSSYNVDGQARTHTCAPLQSATATLRFPDGTPTGFYAYADDPIVRTVTSRWTRRKS